MNGWYKFPDGVSQVPNSEGVYLLAETASEDGIVYAGRADKLRDRLSQHPDPNNSCLQRKNINYFAYEVTSDSETREQQLIYKYDPECNRM